MPHLATVNSQYYSNTDLQRNSSWKMPKKVLVDEDEDGDVRIEDYIDLSPSFDNSPIRSELDIKLNDDDNDSSLEALRRA